MPVLALLGRRRPRSARRAWRPCRRRRSPLRADDLLELPCGSPAATSAASSLRISACLTSLRSCAALALQGLGRPRACCCLDGRLRGLAAPARCPAWSTRPPTEMPFCAPRLLRWRATSCVCALDLAERGLAAADTPLRDRADGLRRDRVDGRHRARQRRLDALRGLLALGLERRADLRALAATPETTCAPCDVTLPAVSPETLEATFALPSAAASLTPPPPPD